VSKVQHIKRVPPDAAESAIVEESMPFSAGDVIGGKYQIIELIGVGGMGFVVSAIHVDLGEKVALKFLRSDCLANRDLVGRFAREARASVKIKSEYVARVFDVGTMSDGSPFIVMEYLEGRDLYEVVQQQGPLSIKQAVEYTMQACEALATAHAVGVVHRDIKPENLFLSRQPQGLDVIKVLDFGISKVALTGSVYESKAPLVQTLMPLGSPFYMSPEQLRGLEIDSRTDIWSLGCVLFELLAGHAPFNAPSITLLTAMILEQSAPPLRSVCPDAPPALEAIIARCLEKEPERRYQNVGQLALALYPFAPRRARLSAERCCYMLKNAGHSIPEFETPSVAPPAMDSASKVPIPDSAVGRVSGAISIEPSFEAPPAKGPRWVVPVGLALALLAGGYGVLKHRASAAKAATEASPPPPAAGTMAIVPGAELPATAAPSTALPAPAHPRTTAVIVPGGGPKPKASTAKSRPARPAPASGDSHEVDVGF
jgi:eukaryotic-like serine/threonine-protein kinase